ncbi:hypothetical protein F2Q68_00037400 [Brassica cretica]|uniref:Citrulline--aspartate ligase n=1 Tax=Brassica cretica TaxID=69181 RepID=A0A8S9GUZ0_BRACR|nr:hypothetical protein F2Q68_00037400 [Brassica cretica]
MMQYKIGNSPIHKILKHRRRKSSNSLYRQDISSFEGSEIYNQADAAGFIRLYGLPMRVRAMLEKGI